MNEVIKEIQREIPWCMLIANYIVLVGKNREEVNETRCVEISSGRDGIKY